MKSITVYRLDKNTGEVLRIPAGRGAMRKEQREPRTEAEFHQNILNTMHELECNGGLPGYTPAQKETYKRVHTYAQEPGYWHSDAFGVQAPCHYALDRAAEEAQG